MIEFAKLWLPIIGAGIFVTWGFSAWYGDQKILATWVFFAGVICLLLLGLLQWQESILAKPGRNESDGQIIARRAYLGIDYGAVLLNSPAIGQVTAWIRFKNTGITPAYKVRGWMLFYRMPSTNDPFHDTREPSNESVISPGGNSNMSGTLPITDNQLLAIGANTESFFVWGRVEYVDAFQIPRFFSFKARMSGPVEYTVIDGIRAQGWGLTPIQNGTEAN